MEFVFWILNLKILILEFRLEFRFWSFEPCSVLNFEWLFLLVSLVRWVRGFGVQNAGLVCCHYQKSALQNGIHHLDLLGFSDGSHFARCFANWRPGTVNGAHEIA